MFYSDFSIKMVPFLCSGPKLESERDTGTPKLLHTLVGAVAWYTIRFFLFLFLFFRVHI